MKQKKRGTDKAKRKQSSLQRPSMGGRPQEALWMVAGATF